jgi:hypothetical protein
MSSVVKQFRDLTAPFLYQVQGGSSIVVEGSLPHTVGTLLQFQAYFTRHQSVAEYVVHMCPLDGRRLMDLEGGYKTEKRTRFSL